MPVFSCGRSLYMDWRMVVMMVRGDVLHHVKRVGNCPGGYVRGGNVLHFFCGGALKI